MGLIQNSGDEESREECSKTRQENRVYKVDLKANGNEFSICFVQRPCLAVVVDALRASALDVTNQHRAVAGAMHVELMSDGQCWFDDLCELPIRMKLTVGDVELTMDWFHLEVYGLDSGDVEECDDKHGVCKDASVKDGTIEFDGNSCYDFEALKENEKLSSDCQMLRHKNKELESELKTITSLNEIYAMWLNQNVAAPSPQFGMSVPALPSDHTEQGE